MAATKLGHALAKVLGINLNYRDELNSQEDDIRRGESVFSSQTADAFVETEPRSSEWIADTLPSKHELAAYGRSVFPFLSWIGFYNLQWLYGDLVAGESCRNSFTSQLTVAGITIGAVVIPQGMAYAKLAELDPQFGLYTSFMGVLIYWFFATSKDITIGVSVDSTLPNNSAC